MWQSATVLIVVGALLYIFRSKISQALRVAAEVMESYNDQYDHDFDEKDD